MNWVSEWDKRLLLSAKYKYISAKYFYGRTFLMLDWPVPSSVKRIKRMRMVAVWFQIHRAHDRGYSMMSYNIQFSVC